MPCKFGRDIGKETIAHSLFSTPHPSTLLMFTFVIHSTHKEKLFYIFVS